MMREQDMPLTGYRPVGWVDVLASRKERFHQRAQGLDEPQQAGEGGEPGDAHQRLTLLLTLLARLRVF